METKSMKGKNFLDLLKGDKVVWIIAFMLCLFSLVCIFSATSRQVNDDVNRLQIVWSQFLTVVGGVVVMLLCYKLNYRRFRSLAKICFWASLILLLMLVSHVKTPLVRAIYLNNAWRILSVFGVQVHVYEVVKVAMVLYAAWAVEALRNDDFKIYNRFARTHGKFAFLDSPEWKEAIFICLPVIIICVLVLMGGTSSALFIGGIIMLTLLIGGVPLRDIVIMGALGVLAFAACFGLYQLTKDNEKPVFERFRTVIARLDDAPDYEEQFLASKKGSAEYYDLLDKLRQIHGAKMAIKEGGLVGKGPGQSTQKYMVPVISEDYMFSFIVEEYGLVGGVLILLLYLSLVARGSLIARNCEEWFAKVAVGGMCLLITGQAFFHVLINCDVGIHTGQTLPMISNGTSSFLCFCFAFGVIISISKTAQKNVEKLERETRDADPLLDLSIRDEREEGIY